MGKLIPNDYRLDNLNTKITPENIRKALSDPEFFLANYQQIVNKERQTVPFRLNAFQKMLFSLVVPKIASATRLNRRHNIVICKGRQQGASVSIVALINYICAFLDNTNNLVCLHTFPVGQTISKFYARKVQPIISGVHPDLYPTMERDNLGTSMITTYKDIKGIRRNNIYELVSANASSIRSDSVHLVIMDECLSGDVEILTDEGFKRLDSLDKTERVAQFDCETEEISFAKPLRYIDREYNGDAFEWSVGDNASFISTSHHDFVVRTENNSRKAKPNFYKCPAYAVTTNCNYYVPVTGYGSAKDSPLTAMERLGIATQADGYVIGERHRKGKRGDNVGWTMCRMQLKRKSKIDRMKRLLDEAGVEWGTEDTERAKEGYVTFYYDLPYSNPKLLSSFLDVECSYERAREILHEILHWDGYGLDRETIHGLTYLPSNSYYSSTVKENRDFVVAIALQAGQRASVGVQVDNRSEKHNDVYRAYLRKATRQSYEKFNKKPINYKGRVYCVTMPKGTIIVRTGKDVWVCGNCGFYRNPYQLEAAIAPAIPDMGFSLVIYVSTFDDKNDFFKNKIITARDNPEDWTLIFAPWFMTYPEVPYGIDYRQLELSEYASETIIPAMREYGVPSEQWGDKIVWYNKKHTELGKVNTFKEYPTTIDEVLAYGEDRCVFQKESLDAQEKNIMPGTPMRFVTDNATGRVEMQETDVSPFTLFRYPIPGHRYRICIDPITAVGESTDYFVMGVFDMSNNEQVAIFRDRGLQDEDYADWAVSMGTIYNKAELCPEINVANGFVVAVNARRYFRWFYVSRKAQADRTPGLRTTVSSKELFLDRLNALLDRDNIILHDQTTLDELRGFIRIIKVRGDGTKYARAAAKSGAHDDTVMVLALLAGSLDMRQIEGRKKSGFAII